MLRPIPSFRQTSFCTEDCEILYLMALHTSSLKSEMSVDILPNDDTILRHLTSQIGIRSWSDVFQYPIVAHGEDGGESTELSRVYWDAVLSLDEGDLKRHLSKGLLRLALECADVRSPRLSAYLGALRGVAEIDYAYFTPHYIELCDAYWSKSLSYSKVDESVFICLIYENAMNYLPLYPISLARYCLYKYYEQKYPSINADREISDIHINEQQMNGIRVRLGNINPKLTDDVNIYVTQMRLRGLNIRDIAQKMDISTRQVRKIIEKNLGTGISH
jgi:hypothetical protein